MSYTGKEIVHNFFAIVIGLVVALLIIIPVGIFTVIANFSFGETPKSTELLTGITLVVAVMFGSFQGGYSTARNKMGKSIIPIIITSLTLLFLNLQLNNFDFKYITRVEVICLIIIVPLTITGGYYCLRKKVLYTD